MANIFKSASSMIGKLVSLFTKRQKKQMVLLFFFFLFAAIVQLVGVASIQPFMNIVTNPNSIHTSWFLSTLYRILRFSNERNFILFIGFSTLSMILLSNAIGAFNVWLKTRFVMRLNHNLSRRMLSIYLNKPYTFFLDRASSDLGRTILSEVNQLISSLVLPIFDFIIDSFIVLALFVFLLYRDPIITIIAFSILGGSYLITNTLVRQRTRRAGRERVEANKGRFATTNEALSGIKITKVMGKEPFFLNQYTRYSERFVRVETYIRLVSGLPKFILEGIAFGGIILLVLFLSVRTENVVSMIPTISLFAFAGYRMMPALQSIYSSSMNIYFNQAILDQIVEEVKGTDAGAGANLKEDSTPPMSFKHRIELRDLAFSYLRSDIPTLKDININVKKNSMIGFVGTTGSGKTTLVDVILGLLPPHEGQILIDGVPLTEENTRSWQKLIGYVPQEIFLTDTSIASNIAYGVSEEDFDMNKVRQAAKIAAIDQFIDEELPQGYDTVVGERGVRLSGGQRQRIGLARALYNNPPILILDEATSALDGTTEDAVMEAISQASSERTMFLIAHRISTVKECDTIYLLKAGKITDKGTYEELLERNSSFKRMAKV
ncbi:MAG: ABC transporter ATP-binding protein [Sphaerochaeta sp.]